MSSSEILTEWVEAHSELDMDGNTITHDGQRLGQLTGDMVMLGQDDGGVRGEPLRVKAGGWLIVEGSQRCYVGEDAMDMYDEERHLNDGNVQFTGEFAVRPDTPRSPEIDGPIA